MTAQKKNLNTKTKSRTVTNSKTKGKNTRKKKKQVRFRTKINTNLLVVITFFTGVLLIFATYAWFSASLNVKIKFFDLKVSTDNGLFISLDGINFSDSVEISLDSVINDLKATYPNHTNQWASGGLWSVSSNGIKNNNSDKFDVYVGEISRRIKSRGNKRFLNTRLIDETQPLTFNSFISFDIFLKNVSGSPKSDNLYLTDNTAIGFGEGTNDEIKGSMTNIMNSMRFGFVKINSVPSKSDINTIQNMKCDNKCEMIIYEPNSILHSPDSIVSANEHGITLVDGVYTPTYGIIGQGILLEHANGQVGSGIPLDTAHFALQKTITDFEKPVFQIPNAITKMRVYVWIEGQDMDSLETYSKGAAIDLSIDFEKDLAGYE